MYLVRINYVVNSPTLTQARPDERIGRANALGRHNPVHRLVIGDPRRFLCLKGREAFAIDKPSSVKRRDKGKKGRGKEDDTGQIENSEKRFIRKGSTDQVESSRISSSSG